MDNLIRALAGKSPLRRGLDPVTAADIAWVLTDPWLYDMFVRQRGWTPDQYRAWLAETLQTQLLLDAGRGRPKSAARAE